MTSDSLDPPRPATPTRADRIPLGIFYMLVATVLFACSSGLSKWQVASYSFIDIVFMRSLSALVICSLLILPRTGVAVFRTHRLRDHVGRNITQGLAQAAIIIAFGLMPLAGAVAINFAAPLVATVAAALLFKEKWAWCAGPFCWSDFSAC